MPVIAARPGTRALFTLASGLLHIGLSYLVQLSLDEHAPNGVDGGPLGFLTWAIPLLVGTLAYDAYLSIPNPARRPAGSSSRAALMAAAYGLSCVHLKPSDLDEWHFQVSVSATPPP